MTTASSRTNRIVSAAWLVLVAGCGSSGHVHPLDAIIDGSVADTDASATITAAIVIDRSHPGPMLTSQFAGLSYEMSLITTSYFMSDDTNLIGLLSLLGPGVLRIGGNSVDSVEWNHTGSGHTSGEVAPSDIDDLAAVLAAAGWQALFGIDFVSSHASAGAAEAAYVQSSLAGQLYGFEVGNEPNDYATNGDEPSGYTYDDFRTAWEGFAQAIAASAPGSLMTGPATSGFSGEATYTIPFASDEAQQIGLLTQHYYVAAGTDPSSTIGKLLSPDPLLPGHLADLATASHGLGGYRITEANSYSSGGVPSVSDTFASALWAIEFLFEIAQAGGHGVNFHGGKNVYSPIGLDASANIVSVQPLYYGMLVFDTAANGMLLATHVTTTASALAAYAVDEADTSCVAVLINTSTSETIAATIDLGRAIGSATTLELAAPALDSTTGITFGSASVALNGNWMPTTNLAAVSGTTVSVEVAPASAVLVRAQ
jgi:hypothetical protein